MELKPIQDERGWYAKLAAECRAEADVLRQLAERLDLRASLASERPFVHAEHDREWNLLVTVDKAIDKLGLALSE